MKENKLIWVALGAIGLPISLGAGKAAWAFLYGVGFVVGAFAVVGLAIWLALHKLAGK